MHPDETPDKSWQAMDNVRLTEIGRALAPLGKGGQC